MSSTRRPRPRPILEAVSAYKVIRPQVPIHLKLDGNEGAPPPKALLEQLASTTDTSLIAHYPSAASLEAALAARFDVSPAHVLVTAGADGALEAICRAMLTPERVALMPVPTFSMLYHYTRLAGCRVVHIPWPEGPYPTDAVIDAVDDDVAVIFMVSPNNPTGAVARAEDLRSVAAAAPHALVVVDHAYVEFSALDLSTLALTMPNVVVTRTFSKAWGLAGLRVGYALGDPEVLTWLRRVLSPFTVSSLSLQLAEQALQSPERVEHFVTHIRVIRERLIDHLRSLGARPLPSDANFVFARFERADWVWRALASLGVVVRAFSGVEHLDDGLRISCPTTEEDFGHLCEALTTVLKPEAVVGPPMDSPPTTLPWHEGSASALRHAWAVCQSLDEVESARLQGRVPIAWTEAPAEAWLAAGAAQVVRTRAELEECLP